MRTIICEPTIHKKEQKYRTEIIGTSEEITYAINKAIQVAKFNSSVLLEGETGVGKELFAQTIHEHSSRKDKPFIKVNCAALPKELIESELFGHEKGAFTGATASKKGRFELAEGGTIFLDEIGEMPLELQPKLLRVLQNGEFERLGSEESRKVNVRIISATNRDLYDEIENGNFREDLFYRLNVYPLTIPPLRSRKNDIPLLAAYYVGKISNENEIHAPSISKNALNDLMNHNWPGNIRELINVLERSLIHSSNGVINQIATSSRKRKKPQFDVVPLEEMERQYIKQILELCDWKISGKNSASELLDIKANTLRSRMERIGVARSA
jgi:transcriptional regulator with GAF, ATPase, and Fis domain